MQHKHTKVSSRSGHVPASAPFKVVVGYRWGNLEFVSCFLQRFCSRPEEGHNHLVCNYIKSHATTYPKFPDIENDDWQESFPDRAA
jgi:hypothetical protein